MLPLVWSGFRFTVGAEHSAELAKGKSPYHRVFLYRPASHDLCRALEWVLSAWLRREQGLGLLTWLSVLAQSKDRCGAHGHVLKWPCVHLQWKLRKKLSTLPLFFPWVVWSWHRKTGEFFFSPGLVSLNSLFVQPLLEWLLHIGWNKPGFAHQSSGWCDRTVWADFLWAVTVPRGCRHPWQLAGVAAALRLLWSALGGRCSEIFHALGTEVLNAIHLGAQGQVKH